MLSRSACPLLPTCLASLAIAACAEEEPLFNVFEPPPPVVEVPCAPSGGALWQAVEAPIERGLGDVWGTDAANVWAVGALGAILHFDGVAWSDASVELEVDLLAVHGSQEDDVWAVGRSGTVLHFDGDRWTELASGTTEVLVAVQALSVNDAWMAGAEGVRRWDGAEIKSDPSWPKVAINGLWASGPRDVWFVGDVSIFHWDGAAFSEQRIENAGKLAAIWGRGPSEVYAIGHNTASRPGFAERTSAGWRFSAAPPRGVYFTLWTSSAGELFAGADTTSILRRESEDAWCLEHTEGPGAMNAFFSATGGQTWAVGAKRNPDGPDALPVLLRRL